MIYLNWTRRFYEHYAYIDLNVQEDYIADSLFTQRNIPVKFGAEFSREGEKYKIITCKVRKKYKEKFEEALRQLPDKMALCGYNDYVEYCEKIVGELSE